MPFLAYACALLSVEDGWDHEGVERVERAHAFARLAVESGRYHDDEVEFRHDEDALTAPAHGGDPFDVAVSEQRPSHPPLIAIVEQAAEIAARLKARHHRFH